MSPTGRQDANSSPHMRANKTQCRCGRIGKNLQHGITRGVAEAIVDLLKMIEVEQ